MFVVYGTRVVAQYDGVRDKFCGVCIARTSHTFAELEERRHVYFIEYGEPADVGRIAECRVCKTTDFVRESSPDHVEVDAFLDAHVRVLRSAHSSTRFSVAAALVVFAGFVVMVAVLLALLRTGLPSWVAIFPGLIILISLAVFVRRMHTLLGLHEFKKLVTPRFQKLEQLTGLTQESVVVRAKALGYVKLAQDLENT